MTGVQTCALPIYSLSGETGAEGTDSRALLRAHVEAGIMNLEYLISGLIIVVLLVYLTYALLKPEMF